MTAQTQAQRAAKARKARKDAGLVQVRIWAKPEHAEAIKEFAESLVNK